MNKENQDAEIQNLTTKCCSFVDPKEVPYFTFKDKTFIAKPCHVYDGDTFSVIFDYKGELIKYRCRCYGYDTPEMRPLKKNPNRDKEKELAKAAKKRIIELLNAHPSGFITIQCKEFDKYGRILIRAFNNVDEKSINEIMVDEGHGKWYDGGTKNHVWGSK
jgi:endonuclease YncB( thermonuclease family)